MEALNPHHCPSMHYIIDVIINGLTISVRKYAELSSVLSPDVLIKEYVVDKRTDREIGRAHGLSVSWVCKLRRMYGIETDVGYATHRNSLRHTPLSNRQIEFLTGSLLGDSCIALQGATGYWLCTHATRQETYLAKQVEIMVPFVAKVVHGTRPFEKGGNMFPFVRARSYALPQFTELRNRFYPDGIKRISESWLSSLTPSGFAFWFLDDGSTTGHGFDITTYDEFFRQSCASDLIESVLGLKVSIRWRGTAGNIHVLKQSHDTAWDYIRSEMTSDMRHKTPKRYRDACLLP